MRHLAAVRERAGSVVVRALWGALALLMLPVVLVYVAAGFAAGIVACLLFAVRPPDRRPVSQPRTYVAHPAAA